MMTEDEHIMLSELCNDYWHDFSKLVNTYLNKVPNHLKCNLELMLQDHSSVYSRETSR